MMLKKCIYIFSLFIILLFGCSGKDITGKIVIEYDNNWSAVIILNYTETSITGTGKQEFIYKNPDSLEARVIKEDASFNKLVLYIYEDERIVIAASTREPEGTVSASYEYPY